MSKLNDSENNSIENDFHILIDNKNKNLEDNINDDNTILNSQKKENSIQNQNKAKIIKYFIFIFFNNFINYYFFLINYLQQ